LRLLSSTRELGREGIVKEVEFLSTNPQIGQRLIREVPALRLLFEEDLKRTRRVAGVMLDRWCQGIVP
jgi:hypothetical protein